MVTVTDTLKKTVKNTHGEDVPVFSGDKCNIAEELDKGNAIISGNTIIIPQDKSEEY